MLLYILKCKGRPPSPALPRKRIIQPQMPIVPRLRKSLESMQDCKCTETTEMLEKMLFLKFA